MLVFVLLVVDRGVEFSVPSVRVCVCVYVCSQFSDKTAETILTKLVGRLGDPKISMHFAGQTSTLRHQKVKFQLSAVSVCVSISIQCPLVIFHYFF